MQLAVRSIRPSSHARRNGVPCVMGAPKYVSHVSRCASKCSTATGPCFFVHGAQQRQRDRVVAADATSRSTRSPSASRAASISAIASPMSNGFAAMSPASTTCASANGDTSCAGL